jgi:hypothetical protein
MLDEESELTTAIPRRPKHFRVAKLPRSEMDMVVKLFEMVEQSTPATSVDQDRPSASLNFAHYTVVRRRGGALVKCHVYTVKTDERLISWEDCYEIAREGSEPGDVPFPPR